MPRASGTFVENTFVNGVVTEATGLNFPEAACTDALNVIFDEKGSVRRRKGFMYEPSYSLNSVEVDSDAVVEYLWEAASGTGAYSFVVQQIGRYLYFYRSRTDISLSGNRNASVIDISTYKTDGSPTIDAEPCQFSAGKGYLFVTHKYCNPFYVTYNPSANTFSATLIEVKARDFQGVDDGLAFDENPTVLSDAHEYNLYNQGWYRSNVINYNDANVNVLTFYNSENGQYPSNAEQWWLYKSAEEKYNPLWVKRFEPGNTLAPKGHYIFNAWATDRSNAAAAIGDVTERNSSFYRPASCAFFAGRIFYAGVDYGDYIGEIYFSQIIERTEQIGFCHQVNDPTSEVNSDLLPSDGGVIKILEAGTVHKLFSTQSALIVFASNGVWSISGSETQPFKADDYSVKKISSIGVDSATSFVDVQGAPVFWNSDGIWTLGQNQNGYVVTSVSDEKYKQGMKRIPYESKKWAKGAYDSINKVIYWLYRSTVPNSVDERYTYDSVLTLNVATGAFSPWSIASSNLKVKGITFGEGEILEAVTLVTDSSGSAVVDANGDNVYSGIDYGKTIKFFVVKNTSGHVYSSTWAQADSPRYLDWEENNEDLNYDSYFITGYKVHSQANKEMQSNFVTVYTSDIAEAGLTSSAFLQGVWDYQNASGTPKWSTPQQVYKLPIPANKDYVGRRLKVRGWGKSLQIRVANDGNAPFNVIGWSIFETANATP